MKRVRCPKCDNYITFDETQYADGQTLVFRCTECNKEFGIRLATTALPAAKSMPAAAREGSSREGVGELIVLENTFAYKQVLPLRMGDNVIGRYQKGDDIQCPIESSDPNLDMHHAVLTVQHDKNGALRYVLRDGPSFTGTFVADELLTKKERRIIYDGTLFSLGATSLILHTREEEER